MSLQRAVFWARPNLGQRCIVTSSLSRTPIHEHTQRLLTPQKYEKVLQTPAGFGRSGVHDVCFGNAARGVPTSRNLFQVPRNAGYNVAQRTFATKAVHQQAAETKWWEGLGQFLRGCRRSSNRFNIRKLLWKLGIPYWKIEKPWKKARRAYKNTWLSTMVSAGVTVAIADILAQTAYPVLFPNGKSSTHVSEKGIRKTIDSICANMKQINVCRTLQFALAAVFVGPLSKLITHRLMLGTLKYPEGSYTAQLIIKDALLLKPLVVALYMIIYDYRSAIDTTKKVTEMSQKGKHMQVVELATKRLSLLKEEVLRRYKKPFMDTFIFYIATAPFVKMVVAFKVVPKKNGLLLDKLYKLIFYSFLSHSITSNHLGPEITKRKSLKEIKNGNKSGGGGWVCIAAGKIADTFTKKGN